MFGTGERNVEPAPSDTWSHSAVKSLCRAVGPAKVRRLPMCSSRERSFSSASERSTSPGGSLPAGAEFRRRRISSILHEAYVPAISR
jgi:hypothetical protein